MLCCDIVRPGLGSVGREHPGVLMLRSAIGLASILAGTAVAAAQTVCMTPGTNGVDQNATDTFQQMTSRTTPEIVQALAGVWYAEIRSPSTNQIDYHYNYFEPNGLFQYQSRVCGGMTGGCNDYQGQGAWAAIPTGDGSLTMMFSVSDLNRNNQCAGSVGRFVDAMTMQDSNGTMWRRVQGGQQQ